MVVLAFLKELECSERWDEQSVFVETLIPQAVLPAKMLLSLYVGDEKNVLRELNFLETAGPPGVKGV